MSHQLSIINGEAEFVGRVPAWHKLGTTKPDMTYADAIDVVGYEVERRPLTTTAPIEYEGTEVDSLEIAVPEHYAVVRKDTKAVLGVVGSRYKVVDMNVAGAVVEVLADEGLVTMEAAGALRQGADAWMSFSFNGDVFDAAGEASPTPVNYKGLLTVNHNGSAPIRLATVPNVVVCANTLSMALGSRSSLIHSVRHTTNAREYVKREASRLWAEAGKDATLVANALRTLTERELTAAEFAEAVLDVIAPMPTLGENPSDRAKARFATAAGKVEEVRATIMSLAQGKALGLLGNGSAYDALMVATEALDHHDVVNLNRGAAATEAAVAYLPGGAIEAKKATVTSNLLALLA